MKLYGSIVSPYVARVVMAARAKGLNLSCEAPPGGGIKSPEFLRINPLGKMPVLEENARHVIESMVILDYLEDAYPQHPLLPASAIDRAGVRTLGRMSDAYLMTQLGPLFRNMNPAARNVAEADAAIAAIRKALGDIDKFVHPTGPYLAGKTLSQADCAVAPCIHTLHFVTTPFGVTNLFETAPALGRWWQYLQGDQTLGPVLQEQATAFRAFMASRS